MDVLYGNPLSHHSPETIFGRKRKLNVLLLFGSALRRRRRAILVRSRLVKRDLGSVKSRENGMSRLTSFSRPVAVQLLPQSRTFQCSQSLYLKALSPGLVRRNPALRSLDFLPSEIAFSVKCEANQGASERGREGRRAVGAAGVSKKKIHLLFSMRFGRAYHSSTMRVCGVLNCEQFVLS